MTAGGILRTQGKCEGTDGRNARDTREEDGGNPSDSTITRRESETEEAGKKKKRESVNKVMTHTTMLLVPLCSLNKKEFTSKVLTF